MRTPNTSASKLRVKVEVVRRYYVEWSDGVGIYGGPFDTKKEAQACLAEAKRLMAL